MFYDVSLEEMLREFTKGQYHIAMVRSVVEEENCDPDYVTIGNHDNSKLKYSLHMTVSSQVWQKCYSNHQFVSVCY